MVVLSFDLVIEWIQTSMVDLGVSVSRDGEIVDIRARNLQEVTARLERLNSSRPVLLKFPSVVVMQVPGAVRIWPEKPLRPGEFTGSDAMRMMTAGEL